MIGMILLVSLHPIRNHQFQFAMIDVGQGDGFFLHTPEGMNLTFDGGSSDVKEVGKYRMEPFFKSQGVGVIDYAFISHGDIDHMNGIEEMLKRQELGVRIRAIVLPIEEVWDEKLRTLAETAKEEDTKVYQAIPGHIIDGDMRILCIQPSKDDKMEAGNAASMVLHIGYKEFTALMTGDVEGEGVDQFVQHLGEKNFRKDNQLPDYYTILKVPHHGSKNGMNEELCEAVKPEIALLSAGENNRYGHPHKAILDMLEHTNSTVFNTKKYGAVQIYISHHKMKISLFCDSE